MVSRIDSMSDRLVREGNVFRNTGAHSGRKVVITPQNSTMQHLCYARIKLDSASPEVSFNTGNKETAIICLSGPADFTVGENKFTLGKYDAAYIPRSSQVQIRGKAADLAEFSAEVKGNYPLQVVKYADVQKDKSLHFMTGGAATMRDLNILVGKNVQAGR